MIIPGVGSQITQALGKPSARTDANQNSELDPEQNNPASVTPNTASGQSESVTPNLPGAPLNPVGPANNTDAAQNSRQSLAELEAVRVRFQLQRESQFKSPNKAIQEFLDVADFERRDELTNLVGFDLKV